MDRCSKRLKKKRAVSSYFRKKNSSQFLETAQYKHQIKKLKKVNKELACSIQELKCSAADQDRTLAECTRDSTQMMFIKMKVKEIVETVQKFVIDLAKLYDVIDGKSFDLLKNCSVQHQETRLRIRNPSISTIEESASMSTIESDLSKEESQSDATSQLFQADESRTEINNVPFYLLSEQTLEDVSNKNKIAVIRSSKSVERTSSLARDQASPSTPETPVFLPIFPSFRSQNLRAISELKSAVSPASIESQKSSDAEPQITTSPSAIKNTARLIVSKIPVNKLALCKNNSVHLNVPSNNLNQRKSFVVEEPQVSVPVSDRRGTFVLNKLVDNAKSDEIPDQRGTFVLNAFADNAKSEAVSDRRGTFVLNAFADNAKSEAVSDRRGTFVLNAFADNAKSEAVSDRRGTFVLNAFADNAKSEAVSERTDTFVLNTIVDNKPGAIFDRRTTYFIPTQPKELTNSPKLLETHIPVQNVAPNQTILLCEDMELTEIIPSQNQIQQFVSTLPPYIEKPETKESDLSEEMSPTMHQAPCSTTLAEKLPSPISHSVKTDLSIQHKTLQSISSENGVSEKEKCPVDDLHVERNNCKKSNVLKDSISNNEQMLDKMPVLEKTDSPKTNRRSSRKKKSYFDNFFSDSNESDVVLDEDFIPKKRFSLKPGCKIINPNNKKVFVFKKKSIKNNGEEDAPISSCSDKSPEGKIKDDAEKDVFYFSTSSEDDKSPLKKCQKKKSVLFKNKRLSLKNRQSNVDNKILSKRKSKKSLKPEVNQAEFPAFPRKSILCFNKDNGLVTEALHSNRKSVRFTLADAPKLKNFDFSQESNATPVKQICNGIQDAEKGPSLTPPVSLGKKLSCRGDNSYKKRKTVFKDKENIPNDTEFLKLDTLTSDDNLGVFWGYKDSTDKPVKQKRSRKKKESASLHQKDPKIDDLVSENPIGSCDAVVRHSRRSRPVINFKEPSLKSKMRSNK